MSEFMDWLQQAVFEVETGRALHADIRGRLLREWGGCVVRFPKTDPGEKSAIRELRQHGIPERTARRKIRGG